jgi:hypothetical protein
MKKVGYVHQSDVSPVALEPPPPMMTTTSSTVLD